MTSKVEIYLLITLTLNFFVSWWGSFSFMQPILWFSDANWVSYNSTQFWHELPGISIRPHRFKGSVPQTAFTSEASCKPQVPVLPALLSDLTTKLGVPPKSDNLVEQVIELRKMLCLPLQSIIIDTSEQPDEEVPKSRSGKVPSVGASVTVELKCATFPACGCVHQFGRSPISVLLGFVMKVSWCKHDWLNHWPLLTDLFLQPPSPQRSGSEAASSNPLIMACFSGDQPPSWSF